MKFGEQLKMSRFPEWSSSYLDYDGLKSHLKIMLETRKIGSPIDDLELSFVEFIERELEKVISFRVAKAGELTCRVQKCAQIFGNYTKRIISKPQSDEILDKKNSNDKNKINGIISDKKSNNHLSVSLNDNEKTNIDKKLNIGEKDLDKISSIDIVEEDDDDDDDSIQSSEDSSATIVRELDEEIGEITRETSSLSRYSLLNSTGFLKILKKHDKNFTEYQLKKKFYARIHSHPISAMLQPLIIGLSKLCENMRNSGKILAGDLPLNFSCDSKKTFTSLNESSMQSFVRLTTKYWVHPDNVTEVKLTILRNLPVLVFGVKSEYDPAISSVYLDNNDTHELYQERLEKIDGARAIRLRWYGAPGSQEIYVERKTHREDWTGESSVKERFSIKEKHVANYLAGLFKIETETSKKVARGQMSMADSLKIEKLANEIQIEIASRKLRPVVRTFYNRTAFQLPGDAKVRISLDTELCMIREDICSIESNFDKSERSVGVWRRPDLGPASSEAWPFVRLSPQEIIRFPYAVLEVKLQTQIDSKPPDWIESLVNSNLIVAVPKFSKFLHGVATLFRNSILLVPYWIPQMERETQPFPSAALEKNNCLNKLNSNEKQNSPRSFQKNETVIDLARVVSAPERQIKTPENNRNSFCRIRNNQMSRPTSNNDDWHEQDQNCNEETPLIGTDGRDKNRNWNILGLPKRLVNYTIKRLKKEPKIDESTGRTLVPPIAIPVRVEPKVFFANERTFLSWLHFANLIGAVALSLLHFDDKTGRVSGAIFGSIAVIIMGYALWLYIWRARKIRRRDSGPYDDLFGPVVIVGVLIAAYCILLPLKWIHPVIQ